MPPSLQAFLAQADGRPVVYCTFGTLNRGGPVFNALWRSLAEDEARFVLTTGSAPATGAGPIPASNVWSAPYVPQDLVLFPPRRALPC